ncbi:MAG: flagellar biosynthesis regulator FlaF [Alphaproteobacteria bacterium]
MANAYNAYFKTQNATENPRATEYRLFGNVTAALIEAEETPDDYIKRIEALTWNRDMWATLRIDLNNPDNKLPDDLKVNLISLSIWVEKHTFKVMDNEAKMKPLIDMNKVIMEGLRGSG